MDGWDPPEPPSPPQLQPPPEDEVEEEEGHRSVTAAAAMAKEAAALFQGRRYTECIDVLKQLLLRKEGDPKVLGHICCHMLAAGLNGYMAIQHKLPHILNPHKINLTFKRQLTLKVQIY